MWVDHSKHYGKKLRPQDGICLTVALGLRIPPNMIGGILKGQRGSYFGTSAQTWMNLQSKYDLTVGRRIVMIRDRSKSGL